MSKTKTKVNLSSNQTIKEAIQKIALHGLVNSETKKIRGTGNVVGYVKKIHTDGELAGTVDVQEYLQEAVESPELRIGYHEGVYLSAIQDNSNGYVIIPKLYSDVVISESPVDGTEYVVMFSHVDTVQIDSHEAVSVGVREREPYNDQDPNSPDIEDLAETGVFTQTLYTKDAVVTSVQGKEQSNHVKETINETGIFQVVGDDKSLVTLTQDNVVAKHGKSKIDLSESNALIEHGRSSVKVADGTVYVGDDKVTDDAVLGTELADILSELSGFLSKLITPTMMGPQPPSNVASFIVLKSKIEAFKSSHTGFLTSKVQIQK